jgi:hypothetical protein
LCCDPRSGRIVERIEIPGATRITSCAFGGPALDVLFITSAGGGEADSSAVQSTAARLGLEPVQLAGLDLPEALIRLVPATIATTYGVVPVRLQDRTLVLATANPDRLTSAHDLARQLQASEVRLALTSAHGLATALHRWYGAPAPPEGGAGDLFEAHPGVHGVPSIPFAG